MKNGGTLRFGNHSTVFEVRRDPQLKNKDVIRDKKKPVFPFVSGNQYKGEWNADFKEGFGIQINSDDTKYIGEWKQNKYHGRGTLWVKKNGKKFIRKYVGDWYEGFMEGLGTYYYENGETYRGDFKWNQRCGNGRMNYLDENFYVGEWSNDLREGFGTLNYENGNVFEGLWVKNKKEGPGLFYYGATKKVFFIFYCLLNYFLFLLIFLTPLVKRSS
jgi:hypothetical protein